MQYKVYCDNYLIFDTKRRDDLKIVDPTVELELNKTGSFTFTIYPNHVHFDKLHKLKSIITVYQDDYLFFRGRILNDDQKWHNEKQVTCEGELAFLVDSIQRPYDFQSGENHTTISELFTFFINNHNSQVSEERRFIVGNITVTDENDYIVRSDSQYLNTWDSINQKLIDSFGGYLYVRHEEDGNYIDYLSDFTTISPQKVEFGKNLLDISKMIKGEDIFTALIPLGKKSEETEERVKIDNLPDETSGDIQKTDDFVFSPALVEEYGYIFRTQTWDDVGIDTNLLSKAKAYMASNAQFDFSIEITAADLAGTYEDITSFHLGNYVGIKTIPHNLNDNYLIKKLNLKLLNPGSNKMTVGTTYKSLTEQTSGTKTVNLIQENITKIENNYSMFQRNVQEQVTSSVSQSTHEIITQVSEDYYLKGDADELISSINTRFIQTNDEFQLRFNEFQRSVDDVAAGADAEFQEIKKYIRFIDGNIVLGEDGNQITLKIQNDRISFLENNAEVAYFRERKLFVNDGEFINSLRLGKFAFIPRANGNLSFKKVVN